MDTKKPGVLPFFQHRLRARDALLPQAIFAPIFLVKNLPLFAIDRSHTPEHYWQEFALGSAKDRAGIDEWRLSIEHLSPPSFPFRVKGVADIEEAVLDLLNGYNLANDRNRKLYVVLSADHIHDLPFWQSFKESAVRRNNIVHKGYTPSEAEAQHSFDATSALVNHMRKKWNIA